MRAASRTPHAYRVVSARRSSPRSTSSSRCSTACTEGIRVPSFDELLPVVERVQAAVRRVIPNTGCELASALLARELREAGLPASFVRGHYVAPGDAIGDHNLHAWAQLDGLVLDPTRDQFSES